MMNRLAVSQDKNQHAQTASVNELWKNAMQLLPKGRLGRKSQRKLKTAKSE